VKDNQYIAAIITDTRDDKSLGRTRHIEAGTRVAVPNSTIKWDSGNPRRMWPESMHESS